MSRFRRASGTFKLAQKNECIFLRYLYAGSRQTFLWNEKAFFNLFSANHALP